MADDGGGDQAPAASLPASREGPPHAQTHDTQTDHRHAGEPPLICPTCLSTTEHLSNGPGAGPLVALLHHFRLAHPGSRFDMACIPKDHPAYAVDVTHCLHCNEPWLAHTVHTHLKNAHGVIVARLPGRGRRRGEKRGRPDSLQLLHGDLRAPEPPNAVQAQAAAAAAPLPELPPAAVRKQANGPRAQPAAGKGRKGKAAQSDGSGGRPEGSGEEEAVAPESSDAGRGAGAQLAAEFPELQKKKKKSSGDRGDCT